MNANVGKVSSEDGALANQISRELAEKFAETRVDEQLYERRLVISVNYASPGKLDAENSIIEGNENGMNLLGFHHMPGMRWSDVRNVLVTSTEWPMELEQAMPAMASGQLPPPLSPFRTPSAIFIPVIVRAEIVDRVLRQVFVIFVPAGISYEHLFEHGDYVSAHQWTVAPKFVLCSRWSARRGTRVTDRVGITLAQHNRARCCQDYSAALRVVGRLLRSAVPLSATSRRPIATAQYR